MADKKRIIHVTKKYPPFIGGTEILCRDTCIALKDDYDQLVFAYNDSKETVREIYEGIDVLRVGVNLTVASQPLSSQYGKLLEKTIREFKPDIIHFDYPNPFGARYLLKAIKKTNWHGKFALFWVMDVIKQKYIEKLFKKQTVTLLNMADVVQILAPTYTEDTSYLPFYEKNYKVLSPRIGDSRLTITDAQKAKAEEIKKENKGKTICFFFGRHVEYKGIRYIIEANKYLIQDEFTIYIGGKGPLTEELKELAKDSKNIHFVGVLSNDDINSYLMACDIFLFPSITRNEAYGISLAEALWFGKPSVTFTIPGSGVNWVSINNETGLEVENQNAEKYAEAIKLLASDKALYNKLSKAAKERAKSHFDLKTFNKAALDIYKNL